jgi:membrane fusion protein, heavy metal efflux system
VTAVNVDIGAKVKKVDLLFEIDSTELSQTIGEYRKNFALTELLRRNYERKKSLFDQKITSEAEFIDTQMSYEQSKTEFEATKNKLYAMGLNAKEIASLESTDKGLSTGKLPFRAPISGVVVSRQITAGEMVEPGNNVIVLADLSDVWVWLNIYEQDIASLSAAYGKGEVPVEITTGAFLSEVFYGKIDYMSSMINENSRALNVRVSLNNKENRLRPGMFCHASIYTGETGEVLTVPRTSILTDEGKTFVFKHVKEDFFLQVFVKVGRKDINSVEILDGLNTGDEVVTGGAFMLKSDVLREKMGAGCAD